MEKFDITLQELDQLMSDGGFSFGGDNSPQAPQPLSKFDLTLAELDELVGDGGQDNGFVDASPETLGRFNPPPLRTSNPTPVEPTGELRSGNTQAGDFVAQATGSPDFGAGFSSIERAVTPVAKGTVDLFDQGTSNLARGAAEGDLVDLGTGAAQLATGVLPAGRAARPVLNALIPTAAIGVGSAVSQDLLPSFVNEANAEPVSVTPEMQNLVNERKQLKKALSGGSDAVKNFQRQMGISVDGVVGGETRGALKSALRDISGQINEQRTKDAEFGRTQAAANEKLESEQPFAQKFPEVAKIMPWVGQLVAGVVGFGFARGQVNQANRLVQQIEKKALQAERALIKGDISLAKQHVDDLEGARDRFNAMGVEDLPSLGEASVMVGAPIAATNFPTLFDVTTLPEGSEGRQNALNNLTLENAGIRSGVSGLEGVLSGAFGRGVGTRVGRNSLPPTRGIRNRLAESVDDIAARENASSFAGRKIVADRQSVADDLADGRRSAEIDDLKHSRALEAGRRPNLLNRLLGREQGSQPQHNALADAGTVSSGGQTSNSLQNGQNLLSKGVSQNALTRLQRTINDNPRPAGNQFEPYSDVVKASVIRMAKREGVIIDDVAKATGVPASTISRWLKK